MSADNGTTHGSEWDDESFRARVTAIAQQQNRSLRDVCTKAGLAADYLSKTTYSGRNIRAILPWRVRCECRRRICCSPSLKNRVPIRR